MNQPRLTYLFEKYYSKTASPEEMEELANLITMNSYREQVMQLMADAWEKYEGEGMIISARRTEEMLRHILHAPLPLAVVDEAMAEEKRTGIRRIPDWLRVAAAAAVLILLVRGYQLWTRPAAPNIKQPATQAPLADVNPGKYKASLVLADGSSIVLDSAGAGKLAQQGSTAVVNNNGQVAYNAGKKDTGAIMYNTIVTGKGETYAFTLADGSKVWLNSASSINFPVSFPGSERRIRITGEVYVQVAKDPSKTFMVTARGLDVQALGTAFDINAYSDEENINTTLIEGAVKLTGASGHAILKPGEQAHLDNNGSISQPKDVDVEEIVSWKEGNFQFESADIRTILRQLARWYDVEVVYEGPVKEKKFFGIISRNSPLSNVLEMLKASDITFRIEGKKLYVTPI
jgi:ferric-dicitrate binding protein FerR (iron transport regulator)